MGAGGICGLVELALSAVLGIRGPATALAGPTLRRVDLLPSPASELVRVVRKVAVGRHSIRIGAPLWVLT
jgi:hypothetical protein